MALGTRSLDSQHAGDSHTLLQSWACLWSWVLVSPSVRWGPDIPEGCFTWIVCGCLTLLGPLSSGHLWELGGGPRTASGFALNNVGCLSHLHFHPLGRGWSCLVPSGSVPGSGLSLHLHHPPPPPPHCLEGLYSPDTCILGRVWRPTRKSSTCWVTQSPSHVHTTKPLSTL